MNLEETAIILVNYNGQRFLPDCLASLARFAPGAEIVVVDNRSTDGSAAYLAKVSGIRFVQSEINLGFGGGCNLGARATSRQFLLLLNVDATLSSPLLPLLEYLAQHPETAVVGGRVRYVDQRPQYTMGLELTPARLIASWLGLGDLPFAPLLTKRCQTNDALYETVQPDIAWVSGAFLLTRREIWLQLAGMDEHFFMYIEDVDYCRRVRDLGRRVAYVPAAEVAHHEAGGARWVGERALCWTADSYRIYLGKFHPPWVNHLTTRILAGIFTLRSLAFGLLARARNSGVYREKAKAFIAAAKRVGAVTK